MTLIVRSAFGSVVIGLMLVAPGDSSPPVAPAAEQTTARAPEPVYIVYYWRARPGKLTAYSEYIKKVAEPIDEEARKAGVFEEVRTFTPAIATGAPGAEWTHMRVFRLKSFAAWDAFSAGLDAAAARVYPDEAKRREVMGASADLRDLVRQEVWREFR
jgi:hypothetical protein